MHSAFNRKESRGAHAHEDFPNRDDANWMKHTIAWFDGWGGKGGGVRIDYRPVHESTMSDDVEYIKPNARVYLCSSLRRKPGCRTWGGNRSSESLHEEAGQVHPHMHEQEDHHQLLTQP